MPIEDTNRVIRDAEENRRRHLQQQKRKRRPVRQVDEVLEELERIHLRGGIKVPAAMIVRIEELITTLPADCQAQFPLRTTITRVMDDLYRVQDRLLSHQDQTRTQLQAEDVEIDRDDSSAA